jgi:predicted RNA-binding Zn ribbon-like protein
MFTGYNNFIIEEDHPAPQGAATMPHTPEVSPLFLADHPVLDFLNTIAAPEGTPIDVLQSDADVLYWLEHAGLAPAGKPAPFQPARLLNAARNLREIIRLLILKRKSGKRIDVAVLNAFLTHAVSYPQLISNSSGLHIERHRPTLTPAQVLAPIAESAAEFLATADFSLVRSCEGKDCILWFYDRTKSHRRRWCSMQVCGNRHKVESFRERQRAG